MPKSHGKLNSNASAFHEERTTRTDKLHSFTMLSFSSSLLSNSCGSCSNSTKETWKEKITLSYKMSLNFFVITSFIRKKNRDIFYNLTSSIWTILVPYISSTK